MWIEIFQSNHHQIRLAVTPFTGVWIEIIAERLINAFDDVTPFTGVWIEIDVRMHIDLLNKGHTLHGCVD